MEPIGFGERQIQGGKPNPMCDRLRDDHRDRLPPLLGEGSEGGSELARNRHAQAVHCHTHQDMAYARITQRGMRRPTVQSGRVAT